jgi:hypothetical protein
MNKAVLWDMRLTRSTACSDDDRTRVRLEAGRHHEFTPDANC